MRGPLYVSSISRLTRRCILYEEIDPDGERVQLLGEEEEDEFIGEAVEDEQELNVMNSGDESGDEIIRAAPR
ncbi:hypothetical protein COOONC_26999 [Cooperia oncophora]